MSQIEGNTRNSLSQFLFADKLWMVFPQEPNNGWNVVHPLMVGHENTWFFCADVVRIFKSEFGAENIQTTQQHKIKHIHTFFMGFI